MGLISMIKTSKKILRAFNLPLLPVPPAQISLSTQDEDYLGVLFYSKYAKLLFTSLQFT